MGDWHDANAVAQGNTPFATTTVEDDDTGKFAEWEVGHLVRQWLDGQHQNQGFFLRTVKGGGNIVLCSREHEQDPQRPRLTVVGSQGSMTLVPQADTFLTKSTYRSQGQAKELRVSGAPDHALIRFDLTPAKKLGRISAARLRLYSTATTR